MTTERILLVNVSRSVIECDGDGDVVYIMKDKPHH